MELDEAYLFGPTPRSMWSFKAWRVKYDHGTFYQRSALSESDMCDADNVQHSWWFATEQDVAGIRDKMREIWGAEEPEPELETPLPVPPPPNRPKRRTEIRERASRSRRQGTNSALRRRPI